MSRRQQRLAAARLHPIRTALVLGAGSDIAAATLAALSEQGLQRAVLAARSPDEAVRRARLDCPSLDVVPMVWDALDVASHAQSAREMFEQLGVVDTVICAVGMLGHHAGLAMDPVAVDLLARSNFVGPAAMVAAIAPRLVEQGHGTIVVLSSVAAARARRSNYVYGSAKSGLDSFAQGLRDAVVGTGVNVVIVRPGFVRSKMTTGLDPAPFATVPEEVAARIVTAVNDERSRVVWVPSLLGPLLGTLRTVPTAVWQRIAGDR